MGERIALNILARCSGIAKLARQLSSLAQQHGWKGQIAGKMAMQMKWPFSLLY